MIQEFDTEKITAKARIAFLLDCTEKIIDRFRNQPETHELINKVISDCRAWLKDRNPSCNRNYWENNPLLLEHELRFAKDPLLLKAFHTVLYMHYYVIQKMYVIEYYENDKQEPVVGSDIFDVDEDYFINCLNNCIEVSEDPAKFEKWIEACLEKLQKEYTPANEEDMGADITQKDFLLIPF